MKTQIIRKKCWDCQTSEVEKELYMCSYGMKENTNEFSPENTVCIDCFRIRREKMLNKRRQIRRGT